MEKKRFYLYSNYNLLDCCILIENQEALLLRKNRSVINIINYQGDSKFYLYGFEGAGLLSFEDLRGEFVLLPIGYLQDKDLLELASKYPVLKKIDLDKKDCEDKDNYDISDLIRSRLKEDKIEK